MKALMDAALYAMQKSKDTNGLHIRLEIWPEGVRVRGFGSDRRTFTVALSPPEVDDYTYLTRVIDRVASELPYIPWESTSRGHEYP